MESKRRKGGGWEVGSPRYLEWRTARAKRRKRRAYWLRFYKMKKGCELCGYNKNGYALDFDHLVPSDKNFNASGRMLNYTLDKIFKEVRKCRVLCANCHRIESFDITGGGHCGV